MDGHWILFTLKSKSPHHFLYVAEEGDQIVSAVNEGATKAYAATGRLPVSCEMTPRDWCDVARHLSEQGVDNYKDGGVLVMACAVGPIELRAAP